MKRVIKGSTSTVSIPARLDTIEAETDEESAELDDKIKSAENDFDYIISGLDQLDTVQCNEILNKLHETLQEYIAEIADYLTE